MMFHATPFWASKSWATKSWATKSWATKSWASKSWATIRRPVRVSAALAVVAILVACERQAPGEAPESAATPAASSDAAQPAGDEPSGSAAPAVERASTTPMSPSDPLPPFVPQGRPGSPAQRPNAEKLGSGVEFVRLQDGKGPTPPAGSTVQLHLTGWIQEGDQVGAEFWNSRDDRVPHEYRLDSSDLVNGLVEVLSQMKNGERRWVTIPSALAYGSEGYGSLVPRDSNLVVDVQLVGFKGP